MIDVHPHVDDGSESTIVILKSPLYGAAGESVPLPYRIDYLRDHGFHLTWTDRHLVGRWARVARATEGRTTPWVQALLTCRERRRADAVVAMFESEGHGLALARRLTRRRRPPLLVVGCWLTDLVQQGGRRQALYRWLYRSVDGVVVFSYNQRSTLVLGLGLDATDVHVIPFGVDLDELAVVETSESGAVVAVGRDLGRDWRTLVDAVDGTGWTVELMTRRGQVDHLHLPPEVRFHSTVDRASYLSMLASASVVVLPSFVREYPTGQTVLLEAMALGKACVVTDTPAMRDYVEDGQTGVLVPPGDPAALAEAVGGLLDDDERRRSIGQNAWARSFAIGGARAMWAEVAAVLREMTVRSTVATISE